MNPFGPALGFLLVSCAALTAQARLADPHHFVPTRAPQGAVDAATGALYVMGGRDDGVLDLWRLQNGSWEHVAEGPFLGVVTSLAYDSARRRLVAFVANEAGSASLQEHDGTTWVATSAVLSAGSKLLWHPVRAQLLVWGRSPFPASQYTLSSWNGTALTPLPMTGLGFLSAPGEGIGYDSARDRIVVPQNPNAGSVYQVYEWDGTTWTTVTWGGSGGGYGAFTDPFSGRAVFQGNTQSYAWTGQAFVPWSLAGAPMRYSSVIGNAQRQVCQLVGGAWPYNEPHGDAWEFDGTSWQQVQPETADPRFVEPAMVAIGERRAFVFDGGGGYGAPPTRTALWNDGTWTVLQPAHSPPPRSRFALAGDPATGRAFLFGGLSNSGLIADFWLWDGSDWQQLPGGPSGRVDHGLCFRGDAQRVVLYGGNDNAGNANYQTWEWDGASWSLRSATFPPHTGPARLSWHPQRQRTVLTTFGLLGIEIWEWNGNNWSSTNPASRPALSQSYLHATYDPVRETILVVEEAPIGFPPLPLGRIHEWDGSGWRTFAQQARLRGNRLATAGVPGTGLVVLNVSARTTPVLEHDFPAAVNALGSACPDPQHVLAANQPWLGRTYTLRFPCDAGTVCLFASGFSNAQWSGGPLPFALTAFGLPGCSLLVAADVLDLRVPAGASAQLAIALPASPTLLGIRLYHQAAALTPGLAAVSQAVEIVTGSLW